RCGGRRAALQRPLCGAVDAAVGDGVEGARYAGRGVQAPAAIAAIRDSRSRASPTHARLTHARAPHPRARASPTRTRLTHTHAPHSHACASPTRRRASLTRAPHPLGRTRLTLARSANTTIRSAAQAPGAAVQPQPTPTAEGLPASAPPSFPASAPASVPASAPASVPASGGTTMISGGAAQLPAPQMPAAQSAPASHAWPTSRPTMNDWALLSIPFTDALIAYQPLAVGGTWNVTLDGVHPSAPGRTSRSSGPTSASTGRSLGELRMSPEDPGVTPVSCAPSTVTAWPAPPRGGVPSAGSH